MSNSLGFYTVNDEVAGPGDETTIGKYVYIALGSA